MGKKRIGEALQIVNNEVYTSHRLFKLIIYKLHAIILYKKLNSMI